MYKYIHATVHVNYPYTQAGIKDTFFKELRSRHITSVDVVSPCCIVAAVGDGMSNTTGVAGRFFSALGTAGINILAIAQGCSERVSVTRHRLSLLYFKDICSVVLNCSVHISCSAWLLISSVTSKWFTALLLCWPRLTMPAWLVDAHRTGSKMHALW
jgi:hypothetical protein